MNTRILSKNITIYYLYMGLFQLIVGPILTLYLLNKGLNFTQIMTLQSIFSVAIFLLEVPTGAIGDLVGRKISLFYAGIFMALGAVVYITGKSFLIFVLAETLFACGMSLKSGSDTAIVYDTLKQADRLDEFTKIQGKGQSYFLASQIIGSIVAGILYELNAELPLIISAILMILSALSALFFYEIKTYEHEEKPKYIQQIMESGKYLFEHKRVRLIVIYSVFFFIFYRIGFWYYQPYFQAINISPIFFGVIFALFNIVATLSARYSDKFVKITKGNSMITLSVLMAASFLLMGVTNLQIGFLFICLQQVTRGVNVPVFMKYINKHIPSNKRATIISFNSLLKNLAAGIAFPVAGYFMDNVDPIRMNFYTGILMTLGTVFFSFLLKKKLNQS